MRSRLLLIVLVLVAGIAIVPSSALAIEDFSSTTEVGTSGYDTVALDDEGNEYYIDDTGDFKSPSGTFGTTIEPGPEDPIIDVSGDGDIAFVSDNTGANQDSKVYAIDTETGDVLAEYTTDQGNIEDLEYANVNGIDTFFISITVDTPSSSLNLEQFSYQNESIDMVDSLKIDSDSSSDFDNLRYDSETSNLFGLYGEIDSYADDGEPNTQESLAAVDIDETSIGSLNNYVDEYGTISDSIPNPQVKGYAINESSDKVYAIFKEYEDSSTGDNYIAKANYSSDGTFNHEDYEEVEEIASDDYIYNMIRYDDKFIVSTQDSSADEFGLEMIDESTFDHIDDLQASDASDYKLAERSSEKIAFKNTYSDQAVTAVYKMEKVVESLTIGDSDGPIDSLTLTGPEEFELIAKAEYDDGSVENLDASDLSLTYDSNIINESVSNDTAYFNGNDNGSTMLEASYTGDIGETVTDTIDVTVEDPLEITDVTLYSIDNGDLLEDQEFDEDITENLTTVLTYEDGTEEYITSDDNLYYSTENTTIAEVTAHSGELSTKYYGDTGVAVSYYDEWYERNYDTVSNITVLGDPSTIDFNIKEDSVKRDNYAQMDATLLYEDGRTEDIPVNTDNITTEPSGNVLLNDSNNTIAFTESEVNYTATYTYHTDSTANISGSDTLYVSAVRDFEDFDKLSPSEQMFTLLNNWSFWALFVSLLGGVLATYYMTTVAGLGTLTVLVILSWLGGFIPIYVVISLILFEIFAFTVLDTQYIR